MSRIVIVAYRPKSGREAELSALVDLHVPLLWAEGLVTDRDPIVMHAADGTVVEVFEWASVDAIAAAHTNAAVGEMWEHFSQVCDYVPIAEVSESQQVFSEFSANVRAPEAGL